MVGKTTVHRIFQRYLNTGDIYTDSEIICNTVGRKTVYNRSFEQLAVVKRNLEDIILYQLIKKRSTTLKEYQRIVSIIADEYISLTAIHNYFKYMNITMKVCVRSAINLNEYHVSMFRTELNGLLYNFEQLVFYDEVGFNNAVANRNRGRSHRYVSGFVILGKMLFCIYIYIYIYMIWCFECLSIKMCFCVCVLVCPFIWVFVFGCLYFVSVVPEH